jgi:aromatic ring-opening dioxygenase catalytic subunit (LigB family)
MLVPHTLLVPHLPTLMLDEHRGHRMGMVGAMRAASQRLLAEAPTAVVALSARWGTPGPFMVDAGAKHKTITDYSGFGVEVRYDCPGHPRLANALVDAGMRAGVRVNATKRGVDSGVAIPMYFLVPDRDLAVVPLSLVNQAPAECRAWGESIRATLAAWPERVAFIVSGLLTFNLHAWTMQREMPEAVDFDQRTLAHLTRGEWGNLADYDQRTLQRILPEAGLRHLEVLRGFIGADVKGQVLYYEASPGAGAALVTFDLVAGSPGTPAQSDIKIDPDTGEPEDLDSPGGFEDEETGTA